METWQMVIAIAGAFLGSGGLWTFLTLIVQKRAERRSLQTQLLLGMAHNNIVEKCNEYTDRYKNTKVGMTSEEYNNLTKYMYAPYKGLGGNDTALHKKIDFIEKFVPIDDISPDTVAPKRCSNCRHSARSADDGKLYCYESKKKLTGEGDRCSKYEPEFYKKENSDE